jgi:hypothetical protein
MWVLGISSGIAVAGTLPDSTWVALRPLPHQGHAAVFALAVDPSNNQSVLAGNSEGGVLRSSNGGSSWTTVHTGKWVVTTIAFDPYGAGVVLAGTRGGGALVSRDGGTTWSATRGLEGRIVRTFAFSLSILVAGTDRGVYTSTDATTWAPSSLAGRSVDALAVEAIHAPVHLVAGSGSQASGGSLPLFQSADGGTTWTTLTPPLSGTITVALAAGPLPPTGNVRPLVVGTNTGLFLSTDGKATFRALSGGALLPATDYTHVDFITGHYDRFYAASDGGGSKSGGLWRTDDEGQSFRSLQPPQASVTALAVSNDENPTLYVATFQPSTHVASLWAYHDTGAPPQGPAGEAASAASAARTSSPPSSLFSRIASAPQLPYVGLGLGALLVVIGAVVAHIRGRYR